MKGLVTLEQQGHPQGTRVRAVRRGNGDSQGGPRFLRPSCRPESRRRFLDSCSHNSDSPAGERGFPVRQQSYGCLKMDEYALEGLRQILLKAPEEFALQ